MNDKLCNDCKYVTGKSNFQMIHLYIFESSSFYIQKYFKAAKIKFPPF